MKLATRLWLFGALVPVMVMGAVLFAADRLFHLALSRSLDQGLLAQAAVESVSLFDGPGGRPHLHMATSPLVESVRAFAPEGVLFGPDGREVMHYPPSPARDELHRARVLPGQPGAPPVLSTEEGDGVRVRILVVTVASPGGDPYTLRLTADMAQVETAQRTFHRLALGALLVIAIALLLVQSWQARSLARRLSELSVHAEALAAGDLERTLAPERQGDELSALRALLAQATRALKQARDGKERLLADAAHELRTPLTLMRTSLDLALRRERSREELKAALSDTRDEVDRLTALAARLLDTAARAQESEPLVPSDLATLVREAVLAAEPDATERSLTLTVQAPECLLRSVRPQAVRQALDNLLSNALKHAARGIVVTLATRSDGVTIEVCDDGPGIPEDKRELVFEPFHRLRHGGAGIGLGLAIVREVARSHRGRAFVRPSEHGAALVLELTTTETLREREPSDMDST